jgi:hypothetical protein
MMNSSSLGLLVFLITYFMRIGSVFGFKLQKIYIEIHSGCMGCIDCQSHPVDHMINVDKLL